MMQSADNAAA